MKIVKENLFETLNENMQQARSILKNLKIPEEDPKFQELKQMLLDDNRIGYIGPFTKWIFKDREPWDKLIEVYEMVKNHPHKVPPIHKFKTLESLFDFLQSSEITSKTSKAIKDLKKRIIYFKLSSDQEKKLDNLLELNVKYIDSISNFYNKKGRKFKSFVDLFNETESLINNLSGGFNLAAMKNKIKKTNSDVDIMLERPDLLVLRPNNYKTSCALGSNSWCISYSKNYWDNYVDVFSNQYFIYDFTKSLSDKKSMIGVTVNPDTSFKAAHFKDDSTCSNDYLEKVLSLE